MNDIVLKVNPKDLINTANSFSEKANQIRTKTDEMLILVSGLGNEAWSGKSSKEYKRQFSKLNGDMSRMYTRIKDYVSNLHDIAGNYEKAEQANVASVIKLETDVIQ